MVWAGSNKAVNLETGVFVGKPLKGAVGFEGDIALKHRKNIACISGQSESLLVPFRAAPSY